MPPSPRPVLSAVWQRLDRSPARSVAWTIRLLPRRLRGRAAAILSRLAHRVAGDEPRGPGSSWRSLPTTHRIRPTPRPIATPWPTPPVIERAGDIVRSVYRTGDRPPAMDLALLEALNEEYGSRPIVATPPKYDQHSREERAQRRLLQVHRAIDLADKRVLELGCGAGFEVWYLAQHFGADAWGVDVAERVAWSTLAGDRTQFVCADLAKDRPFAAGSIDRVISFTVLEHVVHPYAVLAEVHRILRPGGLAWISANLHRGPQASHLYREISFPWPHLLFSDDVIRAWREKHHGKSEGAPWVNRLTWAQYEDYFREIGFRMLSLRFDEAPLDEPFYRRFEDILGRYPRWDLTHDYFYTVVQKPG